MSESETKSEIREGEGASERDKSSRSSERYRETLESEREQEQDSERVKSSRSSERT